jgi:hypothetical protein
MGARKGYVEGSQKIQLGTAEEQRKRTLARRQMNELSLVPQEIPQKEINGLLRYELPELGNSKTSSLFPYLFSDLFPSLLSPALPGMKEAGGLDTTAKVVGKAVAEGVKRNAKLKVPQVKPTVMEPVQDVRSFTNSKGWGKGAYDLESLENAAASAGKGVSDAAKSYSRTKDIPLLGDNWWAGVGRNIGKGLGYGGRGVGSVWNKYLGNPVLKPVGGYLSENPYTRNVLGSAALLGGGSLEVPNVLGGYNPLSLSQQVYEAFSRMRGYQRSRDHNGSVIPTYQWERILGADPSLSVLPLGSGEGWASNNAANNPANNPVDYFDPLLQAQRERN